jgi:Family of unknown function (DUF5681)
MPRSGARSSGRVFDSGFFAKPHNPDMSHARPAHSRQRKDIVMTTKRHDEIGYGKPPKHTQWKKDQSGNPKGRPRRGRNIAALCYGAISVFRARQEIAPGSIALARKADRRQRGVPLAILSLQSAGKQRIRAPAAIGLHPRDRLSI